MRPRPTPATWSQLRDAYRRGEGSLRHLAPLYGIPYSSAAKRCASESWCVQRKQLGITVEAAATESAIETARAEGRELGLSAGVVVERTMATAKRFLDRIERELDKESIDVAALRSLIAGWKDTVTVSRQAVGMDVPTSDPIVNNQFIRLSVMDESAALTMKILSARESMNHLAPVLSVTTMPAETK